MPVPKPEEVREAMLRDYDALRKQHPAMTRREACREVGKRHGAGEATVSRLLRLRSERGADASLKGGGENNKPAMSPADIAKLVEWVEADPEASWRTLYLRMVKERGVKVSTVTLRRHYALSGGKPKRDLAVQARRKRGPSTPTRFTDKHRRKPEPKPHRMGYPTDLTDKEWAILEPVLKEAGVGSPRNHHLRDIVDAINYQTRTGCAWRYLPHDLPPWSTVHAYYAEWRHSGLLDRVHDALRTKVRVAAGRDEQPSAAIIDSQTAKSAGAVHETGYDAGKKTKGRKRHILVDTLGLILVAVVHAADIQDREGGSLVINDDLYERFASLQVIYSDQGYNGKFQQGVNADGKLRLEVIARNRPAEGPSPTAPAETAKAPEASTSEASADPSPDASVEVVAQPATAAKTSGFQVLPKRWIVERTFGWLVHWRRLVRDFEVHPDSARARMSLASAGRMLALLGGG